VGLLPKIKEGKDVQGMGPARGQIKKGGGFGKKNYVPGGKGRVFDDS